MRINSTENSQKNLKCPKWPKNEPFKSFQTNLEIWDKCSKSEGKYLQLIDALHSSERLMEKQKIELEIQTGSLNPFDDDIISKLLVKMREWFGKPQINTAMDSYMKFINKRRGKDEDLDKFILEFDTNLSELKCSMCELPEQVKAFQLLISMNLNERECQNILTNIKLQNVDNIYSDVKNSIKLLKGSLVTSAKPDLEKESDENALYGESKNQRWRSAEKGYDRNGKWSKEQNS